MPGKYALSTRLGAGTFGVVYAATVIATGQPVVIKRIRDEDGKRSGGVPATALREASILLEMEHSNVIRLLDVEMTSDRVWFLVFERLDCDLGDFMYHHKTGVCKGTGSGVGLARAKVWMHQMLSGVAYGHSHGILHRDLKPQNVLVDRATDTVKLADYGLARAVTAPIDYKLTPTVITLWYRPPEILLGAPTYSPGVDVWSLGVIMAEMINGRPLWPHDHQIELLLSMFHDLGTPTVATWPHMVHMPYFINFPAFVRPANAIQTIVPGVDTLGAQLLESMLQFNPAKRISAKRALTHPWFRDLEEAKSVLAARRVSNGAPPSSAHGLPLAAADNDAGAGAGAGAGAAEGTAKCQDTGAAAGAGSLPAPAAGMAGSPRPPPPPPDDDPWASTADGGDAGQVWRIASEEDMCRFEDSPSVRRRRSFVGAVGDGAGELALVERPARHGNSSSKERDDDVGARGADARDMAMDISQVSMADLDVDVDTSAGGMDEADDDSPATVAELSLLFDMQASMSTEGDTSGTHKLE